MRKNLDKTASTTLDINFSDKAVKQSEISWLLLTIRSKKRSWKRLSSTLIKNMERRYLENLNPTYKRDQIQWWAIKDRSIRTKRNNLIESWRKKWWVSRILLSWDQKSRVTSWHSNMQEKGRVHRIKVTFLRLCKWVDHGNLWWARTRCRNKVLNQICFRTSLIELVQYKMA